jgi:thioredoxin-like negative regulator of GroEL
MKRLRPLLPALLGLLFLTACSSDEPSATYESIDPGKMIEISYPDFFAEVPVCALDGAGQVDPQPTIVELYRPDCPHCIALKPTLVRLAEEYDGRARLFALNAGAKDGVRKLKSDLKITGVPSLFLLYADGTVKEWQYHATGDKALRELRPLVDQMIKSYEEEPASLTYESIDPGKIVEISYPDFLKEVPVCTIDGAKQADPQPTIVELYRPDCPHCVLLKSALSMLSVEYDGRVRLLSLNTQGKDGVRKLVGDLKVDGVPSVFLLHADGTVEKWENHFTGKKALDDLRPLVDKMISGYADD